MRHGYSSNRFFFSNEFFIVGIVLVIIIVFLIIIIQKFNRKKKIAEMDISEKQNEVLSNFESLVQSMLIQHGSGMKQYEISTNLGLPLTLVSEKLNEMENDGKISREWQNEEYTYVVKTN